MPTTRGKAPAAATSKGPDVENWVKYTLDECLVGLQFSLPFAVGECRGTVTGIKENNNRRMGERIDGQWHDASRWTVTWTCAPTHDEKFESIMEEEALLGCYYRGKQRPDIVAEKEYARSLEGPLFAPLPPGASMVNFQLPGDSDYSWPWLEDERHNRWWATLARLNDPDCAELYAPGTRSYPLPLLLASCLLEIRWLEKFPCCCHRRDCARASRVRSPSQLGRQRLAYLSEQAFDFFPLCRCSSLAMWRVAGWKGRRDAVIFAATCASQARRAAIRSALT